MFDHWLNCSGPESHGAHIMRSVSLSAAREVGSHILSSQCGAMRPRARSGGRAARQQPAVSGNTGPGEKVEVSERLPGTLVTTWGWVITPISIATHPRMK